MCMPGLVNIGWIVLEMSCRKGFFKPISALYDLVRGIEYEYEKV